MLEGFIPGREYALEGVMQHGALQVLAIFDKPDPLDGPFFEETIYVTPSSASGGHAARDRRRGDARRRRRSACITVRFTPSAASTSEGVYVLEVAARPIGGLCARALPFRICDLPSAIRNLAGGAAAAPRARRSRGVLTRESARLGVMMIPIPKRGIYRGVDGVDAARAVDGVDEIHITAKPDQLLVPLPEGASYLGFIFARGGDPARGRARAARRAPAPAPSRSTPNCRC